MNSKVVLEARQEAEAVRQAAAARVKSIVAYADLDALRRAQLAEALNELLTRIDSDLDAARITAWETAAGRLENLAEEFGLDATRGALGKMRTTEVEASVNLKAIAVEVADILQTKSRVAAIIEEVKSLAPAAAVGLFRKMTAVMPEASAEAEAETEAALAALRDDDGSEFAVVLVESGPNKISCIKAVREATNLGLKEAKDLVDDAAGSRQTLTAGLTRAEAEWIVGKFAEFGATVEIAKAAAAGAD